MPPDPEGTSPLDPFNEVNAKAMMGAIQAASGVRQFFLALVAAEFTESQALYLVGELVKGMAGGK